MIVRKGKKIVRPRLAGELREFLRDVPSVAELDFVFDGDVEVIAEWDEGFSDVEQMKRDFLGRWIDD